MKSINPNGDRINLSPNDSPREIAKLAEDPRVKVIQFHTPLPTKLFETLNQLFATRPEVELRAYGFYSTICDLSFCSHLPNVQRFRADCLQQATNVDQISSMTRLTLLGIGVWNLETFDFLNQVPASITDLFLGETKSKKPDLSSLSRFKDLRHLTLSDQHKNLEVIANHPNLEDLRLFCIKLRSLELLRTLPNLTTLKIGLGGTLDLSALHDLSSIKSFEFWRIAKLTDISVLSTLTGLQYLQIEDQPHITSLPPLDRLIRLRKIALGNLKSLTDIATLAQAPALEELVQWSSKASPEDYLPLLRKGTLKMASVGFGAAAKNDKFKELCANSGVTVGANHQFKIS